MGLGPSVASGICHPVICFKLHPLALEIAAACNFTSSHQCNLRSLNKYRVNSSLTSIKHWGLLKQINENEIESKVGREFCYQIFFLSEV